MKKITPSSLPHCIRGGRFNVATDMAEQLGSSRSGISAEFSAVFARFEYALKAGGFARSMHGRAEVAMSRFTEQAMGACTSKVL
ncbi:MAG: hypothetical protein V4843_00925 [Pseudomonadota bacterium]